MITFEPDSPWHVGQHVTFRNDDKAWVEVVESIETIEHNPTYVEIHYHFVSQRIWELRQQGVRPYVELG